MIIRNICFFNHFHNGDIFHSKEFVRDILNQTKLRGFYGHNCASNIISDINIECVKTPPIDKHTWYAAMNDTFFLNTWIGAYFSWIGIGYETGLKHTNECSLRFNYSLYEKIYNDMNKNLNTSLKLLPLVDYFPSIDFSKYRTECINDFLNATKDKKKVLLSNGACFSTQCDKYENMFPLVKTLVEKYKNILFIATEKVDIKSENIFFTDDITAPRLGCDLNEIGYISTFCDLIVGRNSGPYCFATNKQNILNPNKTFFAFGERETDCFFHGINTPSKHIFHKFENEENLYKHIMSVMEKI